MCSFIRGNRNISKFNTIIIIAEKQFMLSTCFTANSSFAKHNRSNMVVTAGNTGNRELLHVLFALNLEVSYDDYKLQMQYRSKSRVFMNHILKKINEKYIVLTIANNSYIKRNTVYVIIYDILTIE